MKNGWYRTKDSTNWMLYGYYNGVWSAHTLDAQSTNAAEEYIRQGGELELVAEFA